MISGTGDARIVSISLRVYSVLLASYPQSFRQEYAPHMLQSFGDFTRRVYLQRGLPGMLWWWTLTFFDFLNTVVEEHLQRITSMTKEKFIRLGGWALMLAGVTFILGFGAGGGETSFGDPLGGPDAFYEYSQLVLIPSAMGLFSVGMLGLRSRYGAQVGRFGSVSLAIGATGGGIGLVGALGLGLFPSDGDGWWGAWLSGMFLVLVGLFLFGIAAIRKRPLPRWNALPLLTGSLFLLVPIMSIITGSDELSVPILATIFFLIAVGFIALGYVVQGDAGEDMGAA